MKKPNYIIIFFLLLMIFLLIFNFINYTKAYPGEGDCNNYHGVTPIRIPYDPNAVINLDGVQTESFWTNPNNLVGRLRVPLALLATHEVIYLNISFIMNQEYIYIYSEWLDYTTNPDLGGTYYDGIYFCWSINVPNFSANFDGMDTIDMGGGVVDNWGWFCEQNIGTLIRDKYFNEKGWGAFEPQDLQMGYVIKENKSYHVEIQRKLNTNDEFDVQIIDKKFYLFNLGILNDDRHQEHYISWTYALDLNDYNSDDEEKKDKVNFNLQFLIIILSITSAGSVILIIYYKIKRNSSLKNRG